MTQPRNLIPSNCYFRCNYYDDNLLFPYIQTLRFVGICVRENDETSWLFEEPVEDESPSPEPPIYTAFTEDQLYSVLELSDLQKKLQELTHFHPLNPRPRAPLGFDSRTEFVERFDLLGKLSDLLASEADSSIHISIRYTDTGCFLYKRNGEITFSFFEHPLLEPELDSALFELFAARGIAPSTNYLADRGRTRVIDFPVPSNLETLADIVACIFVSVLHMPTVDELVFGRGAI